MDFFNNCLFSIFNIRVKASPTFGYIGAVTIEDGNLNFIDVCARSNDLQEIVHNHIKSNYNFTSSCTYGSGPYPSQLKYNCFNLKYFRYDINF